MFGRTSSAFLVLLVAATSPGFSQRAQSTQADPVAQCESLQHLTLADVVSIDSQRVTTGEFQPPGEKSKVIKGLQPFCRVQLVAKPAPASSIRIELWLPEANWNGRFLGTGTGGGAGYINYSDLGPGIKRGFATANTDLGTGPSANLVGDSPDRWADFGHRATHEMTSLSKSVVAAFYGVAAQRSYFTGCSTGGEQALSEAQRYPTDYNGIIAGAPANNRTHLHSEFLWHYQATHKAGDRSFLPSEALAQITAAVIASCAGKDGGAPSDHFLTDPRACKFDIHRLPLCTAELTKNCLTQEQMDALDTIYKGPVNPVTGDPIYAPIPFGSESSPGGIELHEDWPRVNDLMYPFQWAFGSSFELMAFDFNKNEAELDEKLAPLVNANDPDLEPFQSNGGKLIMYTGTADSLVPYPDAVNYYERVVEFNKLHPQKDAPPDPLSATQKFFRYYLVPGMAHCGSGSGLTSFGQGISDSPDDLLNLLEDWTEKGSAPDEIPASGNAGAANGRTLHRDICPYPEFPEYKGGNPTAQSSFKCEPRPRGNVAVPAAQYLH
jgi:feruloyl esterase